MRVWTVGLLLVAVMGSSGCLKLIDKYYTPSKHYKLGSAKEWQSEKSVDRAYNAALDVLHTRSYGVSRKDRDEETALIHASKDEENIVIEITGQGSGSLIRIETEHAGSQGEIFSLRDGIEMMP